MSIPLDESYAFCRRHARKTAKNFYFSFLGLPPAQFRSMCALYSYMRVCDDIGDDESVPISARRANLDLWRDLVREALRNSNSRAGTAVDREKHSETLQTGEKVLPALRDLVDRHSIPHQYLLDVIHGVHTDLEDTHLQLASPGFHSPENEIPARFHTFEELKDYCYHVAGVVGLCCIHVWGFRDEAAIGCAIECGLAFQLTNILRDLAEDADNGRVYLPQEELDRFGYSAHDICLRVNDERFQELMEFQVNRAEGCYAKARELFQYLDPVGRPILQAMIKIYGGLLSEIRNRDYDVYSRRVSLPTWQKLLIAADAVIRRRFQRPAVPTS